MKTKLTETFEERKARLAKERKANNEKVAISYRLNVPTANKPK